MNQLARLIRKQSDAAGSDVRSVVERHLWLFVLELGKLQRRDRKKYMAGALRIAKQK